MFRNRSATTGIDVGSRTVKLVRIEGGSGSARITHWGHEEVAADAESTARARSEALQRLLKKLKLGHRSLGRVATAVGGSDVVIRQVTMPPLEETDLRRSLPFEARKHLPLENMQEPVLDFQILGPAPAGNGSSPAGIAVLLVAVPARAKREIIAILDACGIEPDVIDVEPLPAMNALLAAHAPEEGLSVPVGLMDLGEMTRVFAVALPEGEIYTRNLELGEGNGDNGSAAETAIVQETADTLRFLKVRRRSQAVQEIYVCGGAALAESLRERLASSLGVEVKLPDPFCGLQMTGDAVPAPAERVCMISAVGLAMWWRR